MTSMTLENRSCTLGVTVCALICLAASTRGVAATTIDFQDGLNNISVSSHYLPLGVMFNNAYWDGLGPSGNLGIYSISGALQPTASSAIIATFTTAVSFVSIDGVDAGENGIRIDAYDAPIGGTLVGFQQAFGVGYGGADPLTVSVSSPSIWRVAIYQPQNIGGDAVGFDTFAFTPIPEPQSFMLLCLGTVGLVGFRMRQKTR